MENVSEEDKSQALKLVQELKSKVSDVLTHVQGQIKKVETGEWSTAKGVSFLEVKYQLLLSYMINLTKLISSKLCGKSIKDDPTIDRLVEIRTVIEKMRPIDQKLKYQVDKLIKTATTGTISEGDPLRFKPNPDNLASKFEEEESNSSSDEHGDESSKVYRPPKLAAVHYDGDETTKDRAEKQLDRAKKRALSSSVMRELRDEYYEGPEEIKDSADLHRTREDRAGKEREEYEEKYFVRMAVSKKEMAASKRMRTIGTLDELTRFGDISALNEDGGGNVDDEPPRKRKKKSLKGKGKGKKGSKKRKFHK